MLACASDFQQVVLASHRCSSASRGAAAEAVLNGNVLDYWHLSPEAEDEVRLLGKPCTSAPAPSSDFDTTVKPGTRIVRAWDRGYLAVQLATKETAGKSAVPETPKQNLNTVPASQAPVVQQEPTLVERVVEAAVFAENSPSSAVTRRRLVTTPFGSAVALPWGACPTKEKDDVCRPFFVAVGNWEIVQQYGEASSTAEEALKKLEERAEEMRFRGKKGEVVYFEFSVEAVTLLEDRSNIIVDKGHRYETTRHRRFSTEIGYNEEARVEEVAMGGLLQGQIVYDFSTGSYRACKMHSESGLSPLKESDNTTSTIPLREQVRSWLTEILWSPIRWRLVSVSPQLQWTRRAFYQGSSMIMTTSPPLGCDGDGREIIPTEAKHVDVDIQVQATICARCPTGRIAASDDVEANIPERWCNSIAQGLKLIAGLPGNSPMLKVSMLRLHEQSRAASPSRQPNPTRPNSARTGGLPRRRHLLKTPQKGTAAGMTMELNLIIHRWGFSLPSNTQANRQASGLWHLDEGHGSVDSEEILQLVPGTAVGLQLILPPIIAEVARSKEPPLQFLVVLVPVKAPTPHSVQCLMNDALILERIPEVGRRVGRGLDVMLPVPNHLNVLQQARVELRAFLSSGGDLEVTTLGRPLPCRILAAPSPLTVLNSLSTSLLRHRMGYQTALPRSGVEAADLPWNSEPVPDEWNFGGVVITNATLQPRTIITCDYVEQPRLQRLVTLRAGTPGFDAKPIVVKYMRLPDAPGIPQVLNTSEVGDQRVVVDGVPTLGIIHDGSTLAYRIECIRVAHPGPWVGLANPRMLEEQRFLRNLPPRPKRQVSTEAQHRGEFCSRVCNSYLHLVQSSNFASEGHVINMKVPNLLPGRYVFRAQSLNESGYGAFSQASTPEVLVPCAAEQQKRMKEVVRLMSLGRLAGSAEVLERAIQAAVKSGIDASESTLEEAAKESKKLKESFNRQSFDSWMRSQALLKKLQEQTTLTYRPTLEKALAEAKLCGADITSPIMRRAHQALRQLREKEQIQQLSFQRKSMRREKCTHALKVALEVATKSPRGQYMERLQAALDAAENAGVSRDSALYQEARHYCIIGVFMGVKVRHRVRSSLHGEDLDTVTEDMASHGGSYNVSLKMESPKVRRDSQLSQTSSQFSDSDALSASSFSSYS